MSSAVPAALRRLVLQPEVSMTLVLQNEQETVSIPEWVADLDSFRRWAQSDEFPEVGWYSHLNGALWMDGNMETVDHNQVKTEITISLGSLVKNMGEGRLFADRMLLTNVAAALSTEPDATFIRHASLTEGRVRLQKHGNSMEILGTPDMVLEVVSRSSRKKDTVILPDLYFAAGIAEYWVVDLQNDRLAFTIFRRSANGYESAITGDGWASSALFRREFRLTSQIDSMALNVYALEIR